VQTKRNKIRDLVSLTLVLLIIVLGNVVASFVHTRFDLTTEKRYTLSDRTKEILKELDDVVYFKIYLEGDFPAGFDRLRSATKEMLDEFRAYSDNNIEYEFVNPTEEATSQDQQKKIYEQLYQKGLEPTVLELKGSAETSQQVIFPGAIATLKGHEMAVQLFRNQVGVSPDVVLNNSVQSLEYELMNTITKLMKGLKPRVAFLHGHHELDTLVTYDFRESLKEYYRVEDFELNGTLSKLNDIRDYKAIIIAKPDSAFKEPEKFILDQYVMNGGSVLWMIDNVSASMDSLQKGPMTYGIAQKLGLDDLLFKYGVRINGDLVQDIKCGAIKIPFNGQLTPFPWLFFPLASEGSQHPIVKNMNAVRCEFASSIDTIGTNTPVKKTILLSTSHYANALLAPVRIDLRTVMREPTQKQFKRSDIPLGVLLEGQFESDFENRLPPKMIDSIRIYQRNAMINKFIYSLDPADTAGVLELARTVQGTAFITSVTAMQSLLTHPKSKAALEDLQNEVADTSRLFRFRKLSKPTKMIVIADGDVCRSQFSQGQPLPLGFDKYTNQTYGNKSFLLNAMNYLCDESNVLSLRNREFVLRILDKKKVADQKTYWQAVNTIVPILAVIIFGMLRHYIRRRKYTT
jgi:ABC-2 type transport system permease protein